MFKFLKRLFKRKEISDEAILKLVSFAQKKDADVQKKNHFRSGDYCNSCDCHVLECPYWEDK